MRVVILVPWRTDEGPRAAAWAVCRKRWETHFPDWPIYEGVSPEGPFQRAAAINDAAAQAGEWDVALVIDADVMLPQANVREAVDRAHISGKVTWAHRRWRELTKEATERLTGTKAILRAPAVLGPGGILDPDLDERDPVGNRILDLWVSKTTALSWSCCIAIRRDAWDRIGGFDERFIGWGFEDSAFMSAAGALVGWDRVEGDVVNLWHPRVPGAGRADKVNHDRYTAQALANGRLGMRYMTALRRDHGLSDRSEPSSREVIARDIANLRKQDEEYARQQSKEERARFDDWWPSILELIEEARSYKTGTVTVVLHTGGQPDNWPTRREYLTRSVASLIDKVTGPIVQRVVYDCWGDPAIRAELSEIMEPLGFYVVGPEHPTDFTEGMQAMWGYLRKRAKGDYIFAVEDDFEYERPVDLGDMIAVLRRKPYLAQMALLRDACYADEKDTGGILGWPLPAFTFHEGWFSHRQFFTLNPSLIRQSLTHKPWPSGRHSETLFGKSLLNDPRTRMGFWGDGENWITHIGAVRAGVGY